MPVILVFVIAVVWIAILAPNVMKRRARSGDGISSISHFHRQLRVLEHSAPVPIVAPAYRLRAIESDGTVSSVSGAGEGTAAPVLTVVGADQLPRPALAFLGRDSEEPTPEPPRPVVHAPVPTTATRELLRRRRRDTLGVLVAVVVTTFLIGFLPGATMAWVVSGLAAMALTAYVALLARLRRLTEERTLKLRYLREGPVHELDVEWPPAVDGRFAHPAYRVSAAR